MHAKSLHFGLGHLMGPFKFVGPLVVTVVVGALLAIYGKIFELQDLHGVAKSLTTLVLVIAVWHNGDHSRWYTRAIVAGMALSLLGDIALLRSDLFVVGLLLFALAHIAYLFGLSHRVRFGARILPFVLVALFAAAMLLTLWPRLSSALQWPVLVYVVLICAMAAQAWVCYLERGDRLARYAALGATLFLLSDALLAIDRFVLALPLAAIWILLPYWMAQTLIAISVNRSDGSR